MTDKKFLTKEEVVAADDLQFEDVEVPEWGGWVRIIGLNAKDAQRYVARMVSVNPLNGKVQKLNLNDTMTDLLVKTLVNDKNVPLFNEKEIEELGKKSAVIAKKLFEKAQRLSGLDEQSKKDIKENLA